MVFLQFEMMHGLMMAWPKSRN